MTILPFDITWSESSSPVGGSIDLTGIKGYEKITKGMIHIADIAVTYTKSGQITYSGSTCVSSEFGSEAWKTQYDASTGKLNLRLQGAPRLKNGRCTGNIIIVKA